MTRKLLGVDPGIGGGLVLLTDKWDVVSFLRMPVYKVNKRSEVNCAALAGWIASLGKVDYAYVEVVHAMPGQGVTSTFTFGQATGSVLGVLAGLQLPTVRVLPQVWKKRAGLIGLDKDASRGLAIRYWPMWRALDGKSEGQALADAAFIARFGYGEELANTELSELSGILS